MRGFYRYTQDGAVIGEIENVITTSGKLLIARYLASLINSYAGAIAIGIDETEATSNDSRLGYEIARVPIIMRNVTGPSSDIFQISFKGVLPPQMEGFIIESGIISQIFNKYSGVYGDRLLSRFVSGEGWNVLSSSSMQLTYENLSYDSGSGNVIRIGGEAARITASSSASPTLTLESTIIQGDFSGYSSTDQFGLAYSAKQVPSGTNIQVKFYSDSSNYFSTTQVIPVNGLTGAWTYKVLKFPKSDFSVIGSPNWARIVKTQIVVSTSNIAEFVLDGFSTFDTDYINPDYAIISRSVSNTPILKSSGKTMDVEYFLEFRL